jgi:hypothetical protein
MKRALYSMLFGVIFLAALGWNAPVAQAGSCSLARVAGRYGYTTSGSIPTLGPFAAVGHVTFDSSGHFDGAQTTSFAGTIFDETVSGTFTVNSDCTGTAVVNVYHSGVLFRTTNLDIVWVSNRNEIRAIFRTAGTAITVEAKRIFSEDD